MKKAIDFISHVQNIEKAMADMVEFLGQVASDGHKEDLTYALNEIQFHVTPLEPLVLKVGLDKVFAAMRDITLIETINAKDPNRSLVSRSGVNWYELVKSGDADLRKVPAIRTVDQAFESAGVDFDLRDVQRIIELVKEGKL